MRLRPRYPIPTEMAISRPNATPSRRPTLCFFIICRDSISGSTPPPERPGHPCRGALPVFQPCYRLAGCFSSHTGENVSNLRQPRQTWGWRRSAGRRGEGRSRRRHARRGQGQTCVSSSAINLSDRRHRNFLSFLGGEGLPPRGGQALETGSRRAFRKNRVLSTVFQQIASVTHVTRRRSALTKKLCRIEYATVPQSSP